MPDKSLQIAHGNPEGPRIAGKRSRARGCATTPAHGPSRWGQNTERGRPARKTGSAGVSPAMTNAGKMPALQRGIGLNAARESGSAGVSPATTNAGKMPALQRGSDLNAVRESGSAGVSPATTKAGKMPALHKGSVLNLSLIHI